MTEESILRREETPRQLVARQWEPIETAPKDATEILVRYVDHGRVVVRDAHWACDLSGSDQPSFIGWFYWSGYDFRELPNDPTHWMPLPPPPEILGVRAATAPATPPDGIALIAAERQRQTTVEGWTPEHDDSHDDSQLLSAAIVYAERVRLPESFASTLPPMWPWAAKWWKPSADPIRNLVKAGALIAAEIDRLNRADSGEVSQPATPPGETAAPPDAYDFIGEAQRVIEAIEPTRGATTTVVCALTEAYQAGRAAALSASRPEPETAARRDPQAETLRQDVQHLLDTCVPVEELTCDCGAKLTCPVCDASPALSGAASQEPTPASAESFGLKKEMQPVVDELRRRMANATADETAKLDDPSEGPFEFAWFCRHSGERIQTVADVIETLALSAEKSTRAELYGVCLAERDEHGKQMVVCYTGNGPRSEANARLIARLLSDYRTTASLPSGASPAVRPQE